MGLRWYSFILLFSIIACNTPKKEKKNPKKKQPTSQVEKQEKRPFFWESANIYFLLTDRFNNGDPDNDLNLERTDTTAVLRGFEGGDIAGITQKLKEGYFNNLGVNAIWFTPVVEQIHGATDEGTGVTYGYHGYWTKDWTAIDPNFGTKEELAEMIQTAHSKDIRVIMDVVLNHTGPVTEIDPVWPKDWVRTRPACDFKTYKSTTQCTLVENLPDILTESDVAVELPDALLAKWKSENRLSQELDELNLFFSRTGYPRVPRYYIMKWLTDYVHDLGIDGFRVDTVKHVNESAWTELRKEADYAFDTWKKKNPEKVLDDNGFYMVGEVYNYQLSKGREFDFGDIKVDYFNHGFSSLINFDLKNDAKGQYEKVFQKYADLLQNSLKDASVVNYLSSHDDGEPFDPERKQPFKAANMLLMAPGASQIYYGDEISRPLLANGAQGDANLRTVMDWNSLDAIPNTRRVLAHWQKLGKFRSKHPAIGAGYHKRMSNKPYVFSRSFAKGDYKDKVVVGLELPTGKKKLNVKGFFGNGTKLRDAYSNTEVIVANDAVELDNGYNTALLELAN